RDSAKVFCQSGVSRRKIWIEYDSPLQSIFSERRSRSGLSQEVSCLQKRRIGSDIRFLASCSRAAWGQRHSQRQGYRLGDLILNRENVRHLAIVALRPEVISVGGVDELRRHANAASRAPNAPFQDRLHRQRLGDPANVLLLAPEGERRGSRRYF